MKKRVLMLIGGVVLISIFAYYRSAKEIIWGTKNEQADSEANKNELVQGRNTRDISAEASYPTPGDYDDNLRFIVTIDTDGVIQKIQTLDAETNQVPAKKVEFTEQINAILKGKKLSELTQIDKVGKSSLTTDAFNSALAKLQASI